MKLTNIYKDLISCRLKDERVIIGEIKGDEDDNRQLYGVSNNQYMLYCIPKEEFLLDVDKALSRWSKLNMEDFNPKNVEEVARKNKMFNIESCGKKYTVELIGNKYINTKYLKNFENPTFKTDTSKQTSPVYVYEKELLAGMVLPINTKAHPELE